MPHVNSLKNIDGISDVRFRGNITLDSIKRNLEVKVKDIGFPIAIFTDDLVSGNIFNKKTEKCIIIKNLDHANDYFYYCLYVRHAGNYTTLYTRYAGESKLTIAKHKEDEKKDSILGLMGVYNIDQAKFDEEYLYYDLIDNAIRNLVE